MATFEGCMEFNNINAAGHAAPRATPIHALFNVLELT